MMLPLNLQSMRLPQSFCPSSQYSASIFNDLKRRNSEILAPSSRIHYKIRGHRHDLEMSTWKIDCQKLNNFSQIHALDLQLYAYTFKNELHGELCWNYAGEVRNELNKFLSIGLDGYFSDYPNTVSSFLKDHQSDCSSFQPSNSVLRTFSGLKTYSLGLFVATMILPLLIALH